MFGLTVLRSGISRLKLSRASSICGQEPIMADKNFQTLPFTLRGTCRRLTCRGSDHLYTRRLAFYAERRKGFLRGETPAWQGAKRVFARAPCSSRETKDLSLTRGKRSGSESRTRSPLCVWGTGLGRREVKKRGGGRTTIGKARTR